MRNAGTAALWLSIVAVWLCADGQVRAAVPATGPATAPTTRQSLVPAPETRTGVFVADDWPTLSDGDGRRLVAIVVERGGSPARAATREELWRLGRKVEAAYRATEPPPGGGRAGAGGGAAGKAGGRDKGPDLLDVEPAATFRVYVPESYRPGRLYGLLVWNSPSPRGDLPEPYRALCDKYRLIAVGPDAVGNDMYVPWRRYRALEAATQARRRFTIDPERVYVSGLSGGGRISSQVALLYADVFTGCLPLIGCDSYAAAPAGGGAAYPGFWSGADAALVTRAKIDGRFALITGTKDPNQNNTECVYRLYQSLQFAHVTYYEVPGMGHTLPPADWYEKGLADLDAPLGDPMPLYLGAPNLEKQHQTGRAYLAYARAAARGAGESFAAEAQSAADELYKKYADDVAILARLVADGPPMEASPAVKRFRTEYAPFGDDQAAAFETELKASPGPKEKAGRPAK